MSTRTGPTAEAKCSRGLVACPRRAFRTTTGTSARSRLRTVARSVDVRAPVAAVLPAPAARCKTPRARRFAQAPAATQCLRALSRRCTRLTAARNLRRKFA